MSKEKLDTVVIYGMNFSPEVAGIGPYTSDIASGFESRGFLVKVITAHPHYPGWIVRDRLRSRKWTKEKQGAISIYRCPLLLTKNVDGFKRLIPPLSFAISSSFVAFFRIVRDRPRYTIVVEPTLFAAPLAIFAALLVSSKTILHIQDLEVDAAFSIGHLGKFKFLSAFIFAIESLILRRFNLCITIANSMAERLKNKGVSKNNVQVVRNWVDLERIVPLQAKHPYRKIVGVQSNSFLVLYSGNIGRKQGINIIIQAARLLSNVDGIEFLICGDGPMRAFTETAAQELGNLRVIGFQPIDCMAEFLATADLLILPQERDAADLMLPSKLGGMLASGRDVLVTCEAGTELYEFLCGSCITTPPGDAKLVAQAIKDQFESAYRQSSNDLNRAEMRNSRLKLASLLGKKEGVDRFVTYVTSL